MHKRTIAVCFGFVGLGLGGLELLATPAFARITGVGGKERTVKLMGLREVGSGFALLSRLVPNPWMLVRAGGDLLDAMIYVSAVGSSNPRRNAARLMFAASMGAFCMDAVATVLVWERTTKRRRIELHPIIGIIEEA